MIDYYELLEVSRKASTEVILTAYKTLAKRWHPDGIHTIDKVECERMMKLINEAREVLCNSETREKYNQRLLDFERVNFEDDKVHESVFQDRSTPPHNNSPDQNTVPTSQGNGVTIKPNEETRTRKNKRYVYTVLTLITFGVILAISIYFLNANDSQASKSTKLTWGTAAGTTGKSNIRITTRRTTIPVYTTVRRTTPTFTLAKLGPSFSDRVFTTNSYAYNGYVSVLNVKLSQYGNSLFYSYNVNNTSGSMVSVICELIFSNKSGAELFRTSYVETAFSITGAFARFDNVTFISEQDDIEVSNIVVKISVAG